MTFMTGGSICRHKFSRVFGECLRRVARDGVETSGRCQVDKVPDAMSQEFSDDFQTMDAFPVGDMM
jgi:hypothetical protein